LRDYSVLTPRQYRIISARADRPQPDTEAQDEINHRRKLHRHLQTTVADWNNTITNNRHERQTRLQREAAAEEQRRAAIDLEERKYRKLKRDAKLAEARTLGFLERPEVRAVNSQLLLHEVQLERDMQVEAKERKHLEEMRRQMKFDEQYRQRYEEMMEFENRQLRERRQKAAAAERTEGRREEARE
jgi:hypothetical protein